MPRVEFKEPIRVEAAHFLECIVTGNTPVSGPENARAVVAVLEGAQQSLRSAGVTTKL
jgi:hypothetical protein